MRSRTVTQRSTKPDAFFVRKAVSRFSIGVRMRFALRVRRLSIVFRCAVPSVPWRGGRGLSSKPALSDLTDTCLFSKKRTRACSPERGVAAETRPRHSATTATGLHTVKRFDHHMARFIPVHFPPARLLIVSSGERFGFERFPQPQPPTGCGKHRRCQKRFCSCFHASFVDTWERSGQPRCYDCRLQYVETSRAECRAAGCTLFPNEYSDFVWYPNPTLL